MDPEERRKILSICFTLKAGDWIKCLGLKNMNASGTRAVFHHERSAALYQSTGNIVARLTNIMSKDEMKSCVLDEDFEKTEVATLLARFGNIWARGDRSHLIPANTDRMYPKDLFVDDTEDRQKIQVYMHCWIMQRAYKRKEKAKELDQQESRMPQVVYTDQAQSEQPSAALLATVQDEITVERNHLELTDSAIDQNGTIDCSYRAPIAPMVHTMQATPRSARKTPACPINSRMDATDEMSNQSGDSSDSETPDELCSDYSADSEQIMDIGSGEIALRKRKYAINDVHNESGTGRPSKIVKLLFPPAKLSMFAMSTEDTPQDSVSLSSITLDRRFNHYGKTLSPYQDEDILGVDDEIRRRSVSTSPFLGFHAEEVFQSQYETNSHDSRISIAPSNDEQTQTHMVESPASLAQVYSSVEEVLPQSNPTEEKHKMRTHTQDFLELTSDEKGDLTRQIIQLLEVAEPDPRSFKAIEQSVNSVWTTDDNAELKKASHKCGRVIKTAFPRWVEFHLKLDEFWTNVGYTEHSYKQWDAFVDSISSWDRGLFYMKAVTRLDDWVKERKRDGLWIDEANFNEDLAQFLWVLIRDPRFRPKLFEMGIARYNKKLMELFGR
ncbi:hypothetical protein CC78DRAFT_259737 [Lojkania enalia]|uniref:Uncharacterized protein n=1 Tax=Lojkania enalia TaxID=147567 RepID=A0A9P4N3W1_9PLEO|nr:hypothetical protein CC78DRAFT_259737 [Didymosphaeria enalia]